MVGPFSKGDKAILIGLPPLKLSQLPLRQCLINITFTSPGIGMASGIGSLCSLCRIKDLSFRSGVDRNSTKHILKNNGLLFCICFTCFQCKHK